MVIGFTGLMGSGKSEAANYLATRYRFERVNFKDGLVKELKERMPDLLDYMSHAFDVPVDELFTLKPPPMRALMQNYGTDVRRKENDRYWVDRWLDTLATTNALSFVADDVRFMNEADAITSAGGVIVRIIRTDVINTGSHASETEQSQIVADYTISVGKGELDKLFTELDKIIQTEKDEEGRIYNTESNDGVQKETPQGGGESQGEAL